MRELQKVSVGDILDHGFRSVAAPEIELGPFESEALKGILSVTSVIGIWGGPYDNARLMPSSTFRATGASQ